MLRTHRRMGLTAFTVGLQGRGSIYTRPLPDTDINSAFRWEGTLKPAYLARPSKVLDATGLVVIVDYFYWRQCRFNSEEAAGKATRNAIGYSAPVIATSLWTSRTR